MKQEGASGGAVEVIIFKEIVSLLFNGLWYQGDELARQFVEPAWFMRYFKFVFLIYM